MWCESILRNSDALADLGGKDPHVDPVEIHWNECGRLLKAKTRSGPDVRVVLPAGQMLRHNDVIYEDATRTVVVHLMPCEVVVAWPARVTHVLGTYAVRLIQKSVQSPL